MGHRHGKSFLFKAVTSLAILQIAFGFSYFGNASDLKPTTEITQVPSAESLLAEIKKVTAKYKWNAIIFEKNDWKVWTEPTAKNRPLIYFECGEKNENTTLMISNVHGDEITPMYFGFRLVYWAKTEPDLCQKYHIVIAPLINPDGALATKPTRTNSKGVDLNRNFPTKDFEAQALSLWKQKMKSNKRFFPGEVAGSEVETKFQEWLIDHFKPSKILTVHSPYNFFDYDGPDVQDMKTLAQEYVKSCLNLRQAVKNESENYKFLRFGFFPGSLGNYAGKERGIPTLTLELPDIDAHKAKTYFDRLKRGTRALVMHKIQGQNAQLTKQ